MAWETNRFGNTEVFRVMLNDTPTAAVPVPETLVLLASGLLAGLGLIRRRAAIA